jgi:excisionase family DNA binding protein
MTKPRSMTIEEIADTLSAIAARATKSLREVSDAIAELRDAEMMLKGLAASQAIAAENRKPANDENGKSANRENPRLAYRIDEAAKLLGVSRKTIDRKIKAGFLVSSKRLGRRRLSAESIMALFESGEEAER